MAKKEHINIDDIINQQFTDMQDLSKEDSSVKEWIDSGNYALNYYIKLSLSNSITTKYISNIIKRKLIINNNFIIAN